MNEPKLRFPEFTDDWKQYKFGDIFTVSQGLQIPINQRFLEDGENRFFYITNEFLKDTCSTAYYIENPSPSVLCNNEDILMTRTGNTGIVVTNVSGCFHNNFFKIKYDNHNFSKNYIYYLLNTKRMQNTILKNAGSSTIPDLSHKSFYQIIGYFPKQLMEQEKIGSLLLDIDNLIQSAEKELEGYRELKQGMLQKMFPKAGETVPEIRFPEFTGDWEEHELSEMFNYEQPSKYIVKNDDYEGCSKYPVLTANKGFILGYTDETEGIYDKGEVIIFDDFTCDHKFVNFPFKVKSSAIKFLTPKDNYNLSFLSELLSVMNQQPLSHQRHWISVMQPSIALIPSLEEQKKIGEYFSNLDNLITLQQKELDGYKELKKGLLQQMFC